MKENKFIHLVDTTLRDGSHAVSHQFTPEQVTAIAGGLDAAGVEYIEISHGDGLAGSSYNYGWSAVSEEELLKAASKVIKNGKLTVLLLPGIGTIEDLQMAADCGAKVVRVATHVTEADIGEQHIGMAKKLGMMAVGFLMMSHMVPPEKVVEQAKLFESYGADYVNIADSAGAMLPEDVKARISAVVEALKVPVGFHAHNNLTLATANSLAAVEAGATFLDGALRGLGAGAGNTQTEALVGTLQKKGYQTGIDFYKIMDVAEDIVEPIMHRPQVVRNAPLMLGYAGVYSSFLLHTYRAAEKFHLDPRD
ncbi:MAG: 4-hydroxy-2-oxovalerate/4-hydroxy-2-oxohexanoate aldolase, partial [Clostridia bacterium]|nr:4-hydroxy-2-oxovalerate/4-hydroxy-2-oxohexanoate aldolase [Clostridia bacterium]